MTKLILNILGMHCNGCAGGISFALNALPGVKLAVVSLEENAAHVEYDESVTNETQLRKAIIEAGYEVASAE
jgi:copper chaperone CopZ